MQVSGVTDSIGSFSPYTCQAEQRVAHNSPIAFQELRKLANDAGDFRFNEEDL